MTQRVSPHPVIEAVRVQTLTKPCEAGSGQSCTEGGSSANTSVCLKRFTEKSSTFIFNFQNYGKAKGSSNTNDGLAETGQYQEIKTILTAFRLLEGNTKHFLLLTLQITCRKTSSAYAEVCKRAFV